MKTNLFLLFIMLCLSGGCINPSPKPAELRVMSFNIWVGGGESVAETAKVIAESKADIIGIQESWRDDVNTAARIADSLKWYSFVTNDSPTIISRYPIVDTSAFGSGVKIQIAKNEFVWMFNIHLMYCPYEPYQLNGIEYCGAPLLNTAEEAVASAWATRGAHVTRVVGELKEAQKDGCPVFLTGDFNEPSCLDWTEKAAAAGICKMPVVWPATRAFINGASMHDSYRTLYPDEVATPGHTWTSLPVPDPSKEVLDRIDFVMFWGEAQPVSSRIIGENSGFTDIKFDKYPSDHRAVMTTFALK